MADLVYSERMVLPLWRSLHSLNLMLPKEDRKAMLLRLYNDDSPLLDHSKDRFLHKQNGDASDREASKEDMVFPGTDAEDVVAAGLNPSEEKEVRQGDESYLMEVDGAGDDGGIAVGDET